METQSLVAKRCQALTALIRLTSIAPCQELLDMQERNKSGGRAGRRHQCGQERSEAGQGRAGSRAGGSSCNQSSFPAGPHQGRESCPASSQIPCSQRGRAGAAAKPDRSAKPLSNVTKPQLPASKSKQDCCPDTVETAEEPTHGGSASSPVNRSSHVSRLGLARALTRCADTLDRAKQLYLEVISMAPGVHDAYAELVQLLEPSDPQAAVEVYCRFPLNAC
ncbi:uncharacterized protein LOC115019710 [Cottoperca gobio]|uniref:Uncharacterized protein LOC115019710 n=1 Tax=Cottoperca gobio TaxID=56716 RepID=A0A6J2R4K0_COTGO|nr:uncharacterized protein LOC115019710 [Cottoperca gobio]